MNRFRSRFLNLLSVREEESEIVLRLFIFEFFQGASIALFFTSAVSIFLGIFPTTELPKVFILSAFLLWVTGAIYSMLEERLAVKQLIYLVVAVNGLSILLFRIGLMGDEPQWFFYLMLAWFNVTYLLNNLEFWGVAAMLFDVRQSKRLFAIVSAGDIPAKFLGFISAVIVVPAIGSANLMWIALASLATSLFFLRQLDSSGTLSVIHQHIHHKGSRIQTILQTFSRNKLIRQTALTSFFSFCCLIVVNFIFYGYVKEEFKDDVGLATFIAVFLAISRAITLVLKLTITNRLVDRFGIRNSLLLTPVVLMLLCIAALAVAQNKSSESIFYLLGIMAISTDVLRSAIQSPVLLATMQPLPVQKRTTGHNIMKGIMDPFAFLVVGLLLYAMLEWNAEINFLLISIFLLALLVGWIISILSVDKNYVNSLAMAIKSRSINEREIIISDSQSQQILLEKCISGDEAESLFILRLISRQPVDALPFIKSGLSHFSDHVKSEALMLAEQLNVTEAIPLISDMLKNETSHSLLSAATRTLLSLDPELLLADLSDHPHTAVASEVRRHKVRKAPDDAYELVTGMAVSARKEERLQAIHLLSAFEKNQSIGWLKELLNDSDAEVKSQAIQASGKIQSEQLNSRLIQELREDHFRKDALAALQEAGDSAVAALKEFLISEECTPALMHKVFQLLASGAEAGGIKLLDECLDLFPEHFNEVLQAIYLTETDIAKRMHGRYEQFTRYALNNASEILFWSEFLHKKYPEEKMLAQAIDLELMELRSRLLHLFAVLYDREKAIKARFGFEINTRDSLANAFELLDVSLPKETSAWFISIYENRPLHLKLQHLKKFVHPSAATLPALLNEIIRDKKHEFNSWTKACALFSIRHHRSEIDYRLVASLIHSDKEMIRELATDLMATHDPGLHLNNDQLTD